MLSFCAASSAPLRTRSQKVSPGAPWLIMDTTRRGVSTVPPPPLPSLSVGRGAPPVAEHPVTARASPSTIAAVLISLTYVSQRRSGAQVKHLTSVVNRFRWFLLG